jgi:membrane-associated phospholipid phosphatase
LPPHFEAWPSGHWLLAVTDWLVGADWLALSDWLAVLSVVAGYSGTV